MNSSQRIAAARYAAAYDKLSTTVTQAEMRARELITATQILDGVTAPMQSPRISLTQKKLILQEALKEWPAASAFISVLLGAKRYNLLPEICRHVQTLLDDRKGISRAIITSARVLTGAQQTAAEKALASRYGRTIKARFQTDASLLGGLTMACNGELIDGSLKQRLAKLQEEITK